MQPVLPPPTHHLMLLLALLADQNVLDLLTPGVNYRVVHDLLLHYFQLDKILILEL